MAAWLLVAVVGAALGLPLLCYAALGALVGKDKRGQLLFSVAYSLYSTPLGRLAHRLSLRAEPHCQLGEPAWLAVDDARTVVLTLPVLSDNYAYAVVDAASRTAALIDPGDAALAVRLLSGLLPAALGAGPVLVTCVLVTHWHFDHSAGAHALLRWARQGSRQHGCVALAADLRVYGPRQQAAYGITHALDHDQTVALGSSTRVRALHTPGHTRHHCCYAVGQRAVFTGDLLFVGGVGKFFEATAADVQHSVCAVLAPQLRPDTLIYPGHEYAARNLAFAASVLPDPDPALDDERARVARLRHDGHAAVPATWQSQLSTNPFVRLLFDPDYADKLRSAWRLASATPSCELLAHLRQLKDKFDQMKKNELN